MKNVGVRLGAVVVGLGIILLTQGNALAWDNQLACYATEEYPDVRWKLNILFHSYLYEQDDLNHGVVPQWAYSIHGKAINTCYYGSMSAVDGTVVKTKSNGTTYSTPTGSHLGLRENLVRYDFCAPLTYDCTTDEEASAPDEWTCFIRSDWGYTFGPLTLYKIEDESDDPYCGIFEEGGAPASAAAAPQLHGPALAGRRP